MAAKTTPKTIPNTTATMTKPTTTYISYKQANLNTITTSAFTKLTEKTATLTETTTATTTLTMTKTTIMESKTTTILTNYISFEQENKVQTTSTRATTAWAAKPIPTTITTTTSTMTRTTTKTRIQSKTTTSPSVPGVIIVLRNTTTGNIIESGSIVKTRQFAKTNQHSKYNIDCQVDNINFTCK